MSKFMLRTSIDAVVLLDEVNEVEATKKNLALLQGFVEQNKVSRPSIKLVVNQYPSVTELPEEVKNG